MESESKKLASRLVVTETDSQATYQLTCGILQFNRFRKRTASKEQSALLQVDEYDDEDTDFDSMDASFDLDKETAVIAPTGNRSTSAAEIHTLTKRRSSIYSSRLLQESTLDPTPTEKLKSRRASKDPPGLKAIVAPSTPVVDIIFIYGLGGGSLSTWSWNRDSRKSW